MPRPREYGQPSRPSSVDCGARKRARALTAVRRCPALRATWPPRHGDDRRPDSLDAVLCSMRARRPALRALAPRRVDASRDARDYVEPLTSEDKRTRPEALITCMPF